MQMPLQITLRHMESSAAVEARIRHLAAELEQFSAHIMHFHVVVSAPHHHHRQGNLFDVRLDITVPGAQIAINTENRGSHAHEDVYVALRDAFKAARRKLQDYERERRGDVKTHASAPAGWISEISPAEDFGRIRTPDGRLIYFHRNSVIDGDFDRLSSGTEVRFTEELGDHGPQASTVHVVRESPPRDRAAG